MPIMVLMGYEVKQQNNYRKQNKMSQTQRISKNNTAIIHHTNGNISVILHSTEIVTIKTDVIELNTGGYFTATTKTRMNQVSNEMGLGYQVYQKKGEWFCRYKGESIPFAGRSLTLSR